MIWLALRRHRTNLLIVLGLLTALGVWMVGVAWQFHTAPVVHTESVPGVGVFRIRDLDYGPQLFQLTWQVTAINVLLLLVPCLFGVLLGAPLVAGEYDDRTNRLAWTQGIGRTRWLVTKWVVVGVPLVVMMSLLAVGTHLWSFHVVGATQLAGNFGFFGNGGRMQPGVFPAVGVVPVAYALFAFALGSTLGALVRRTTWAAAATFLFYGLALLVVTTTVRPVLAPQYFLPFEGASAGAAAEHLVYGAGNGPAYGGGTQPWLVGLGYRFTPGYHPPAGVPSPDVLGNHCDSQVTDPLACFTTAHVEFGGSYQPASNFWILQWRESAIYAAASVLLLAVGLWAVRRWRA